MTAATAATPQTVPTPAAIAAWAAQISGADVMPDAIADALFAAQRRVVEPEPEGRGVDGRRSYPYVTAEQIIGASRDALHAVGLFVTPGGVRFELYSGKLGTVIVRDVTLRLRARKGRPACSHTIREAIRFPVDTSRMAVDKATAAAMTTSLAYYLRDLLQIRRLMAGDEIEQRRDDTAAADQGDDANREAERVSVLEQRRRALEQERARASRPARPSRKEARATAAFVGAGMPTKPGLELGDEKREKEAREDAEGARITALAAADPAQPDPEWMRDDHGSSGPGAKQPDAEPNPGPTGSGPSAEGSGAQGAAATPAPSKLDRLRALEDYSIAHLEGPNPGPRTIPPAASTPIPTAAGQGEGGGGGSDAPPGARAEELPSSAPAPAGGTDAPAVIHPEACWECDRHPCICDTPATAETKEATCPT